MRRCPGYSSGKTRRMVILAFFVALEIILSRFASLRIAIGGVEGVRVGLGSLPAILAGIVFGPIAGCTVGALADLIGALLHPMGAYMPWFTVIAGISGALPACFLKLWGCGRSGLLELMLAIGTGRLISSLFLTPWALKVLFGISIWATLPARLISFGLTVPVISFLCLRLLQNPVICIGAEGVSG